MRGYLSFSLLVLVAVIAVSSDAKKRSKLDRIEDTLAETGRILDVLKRKGM